MPQFCFSLLVLMSLLPHWLFHPVGMAGSDGLEGGYICHDSRHILFSTGTFAGGNVPASTSSDGIHWTNGIIGPTEHCCQHHLPSSFMVVDPFLVSDLTSTLLLSVIPPNILPSNTILCLVGVASCFW